MPINIDVVKDSEGLPSIIVINDGGRIATIIHDATKGFTIKGSRRIAQRWFPLLFPTEKQTTLSIPEPLEVVSIKGGKIILIDDMESLLKWSSGAFDNAYSYHEDQSLVLTLATGGGTTKTRRYFPLPPSQKVSLEFIWSPEEWAVSGVSLAQSTLTAEIVLNDGLETIIARATYAKTSGLIQLQGNNETLQVPYEFQEKQDVNGPWHKMILSADFAAKQYISLIANHKNYDLTNLSLYSTSNPLTYTHSYVEIGGANTHAAATKKLWIDDVIIKEVA